jgi:hypothetical protein
MHGQYNVTFPNVRSTSSVDLQSRTSLKQDRQCTYKRNIEARSRNHCCPAKAISTTYSECVSVALVIHHAKRMRRIIL